MPVQRLTKVALFGLLVMASDTDGAAGYICVLAERDTVQPLDSLAVKVKFILPTILGVKVTVGVFVAENVPSPVPLFVQEYVVPETGLEAPVKVMGDKLHKLISVLLEGLVI
jgi:hypothetical protein